MKPSSQRDDLLGIVCSAGCAAHCAAMPAVMAMAPSVSGLQWLAGSLVHQIVAVMCCVLVAKSILPSWRRHRDSLVALCVVIGISLLLLAAFILPDPCCAPSTILGWIGLPLLTVGHLELWLGKAATFNILSVQPFLTPIGGVLLITAHVMNLDLMRRERRCQDETSVEADATVCCSSVAG